MANRRLYTASDVPMVNAGWWNADGTATIYLTSDPSLNQPTLTIANRTGGTVTIPGGDADPYGSAAEGAGTLYLYFNGLLTNAQVALVSVTGHGWMSAVHTDEVTGLAYLAMSPTTVVSLADGETLTLGVPGVTASGSARSGNLTLVLDGVTGVLDVQDTLSIYVAVLAAPREGNRKMELMVGFAGPDFVFTGGTENELLLVLTNPGSTPLVPGGKAAWGGETPSFTLSYVIGTGAGALTDPDHVTGLDVELSGAYGNAWDAPVRNGQGATTTWTLEPSQNSDGTVLGVGANASVSFRLSGIETTQPAGATYLYLSYANFPGYDDGYFAVEIVKVHPVTAGIAVIPSDIQHATSATPVTIAWVVENATYATITNTPFAQAVELGTANGDVYVTVAATTTYTLLASNHYTGQTVAASATVTVSPDLFSYFPRGTIVMWSGSASAPPDGWSLCDGRNGTPNLTNRFILGAGTSNPTVGSGGGSEQHVHSASASVTIDEVGKHRHGVPSDWYSNKAGSGGSVTVVDRDAKSVSDAVTQSAGGHTHGASATVTVQSASNMPPWYALAFIIKTS